MEHSAPDKGASFFSPRFGFGYYDLSNCFFVHKDSYIENESTEKVLMYHQCMQRIVWSRLSMFFFTNDNDMCKYILIDCETVMSLGSVLDISCHPGTVDRRELKTT